MSFLVHTFLLRRQEGIGFLRKAFFTARGAKVVLGSLVGRTSGRGGAHHLHATDGVNGGRVVVRVATSEPHNDSESDGGDDVRDQGGAHRKVALGGGQGVALGNGVRGAKNQIGQQSSDTHHDPEREEQLPHGPRSVKASINEQQRQGHEIREDKGNDAAEGDTTTPEGGRQWNIAHRAHEGEDRDRYRNDHIFQQRPRSMASHEDRSPPRRGNVDREETGDEETEDEFLAEHREIAHGEPRGPRPFVHRAQAHSPTRSVVVVVFVTNIDLSAQLVLLVSRKDAGE